MYYILEGSELFVSLILFSILQVFSYFFLYNTILWNVNPSNFCIEEGWQNRYYTC